MNEVKNYIMYVVSVGILFLFLFGTVKIFERKSNLINVKLYAMVNSYEEKKIIDKDKLVEISYPYFKYNQLDKKVSKIVNKYNKENIKIEYNLNLNKNILSIFFIINNNEIIEYNNINFDIKEKKFLDNIEVFDFYSLKDIILEKVKLKYETSIYEKIVSDNFENAYLNVNDEGVSIYFNNSIFDNIKYKVFIKMPNENVKSVSDIEYDKVVAFTFDDGPSIYTTSLVETLLLHDSKATFFELGNRMKYNQDIVREIYNRGMEIGSHTYAHKNLNNLSESSIDEEVNSTNIIFNEITRDNIKLTRPPYGNANDKVKSRINTPIINWNVDTLDWLTRDSEKIYNHILENISDGSIVLMHDIYPETIEAVKKVLPVLREMGYKVTSVSELASLKEINLENGVIYRSFIK